MGFLDKVKAIKNAVTGGAAKVSIHCEMLSYDEPFKISIRAQTGDAKVKVNRVYLKIRGIEEVEVPDVDVVYDSEEEETHRRVETVRATHETINLEVTVAETQELEENQSYEWETEVELPLDAPSIYEGKYCQHIYTAYAGLDCFGNDPGSGWVELSD